MLSYCQLWLTCKDHAEAAVITKSLLDKHLVACVRQMPVVSDYRWQGKIEHEGEVLLVMASRDDLFDEAEQEVAKLHSYGTFVLEALPIKNISKKAKAWLKQELADG